MWSHPLQALPMALSWHVLALHFCSLSHRLCGLLLGCCYVLHIHLPHVEMFRKAVVTDSFAAGILQMEMMMYLEIFFSPALGMVGTLSSGLGL